MLIGAKCSITDNQVALSDSSPIKTVGKLLACQIELSSIVGTQNISRERAKCLSDGLRVGASQAEMDGLKIVSLN